MFDRINSALKAARKEYDEFPKRQARRREANLDYNIQIALTQLKATTGAESYAFVTAFLEKPDVAQVATFVETIEKLELDYQVPFLMVATKTNARLVLTDPIRKWALKNSHYMAHRVPVQYP
jgi:hypothetical protein